MRAPIVEPYSPIRPSRREKTQQRIEWIITAGLVVVAVLAAASFVINWAMPTIGAGYVYQRVVSVVSGGQK